MSPKKEKRKTEVKKKMQHKGKSEIRRMRSLCTIVDLKMKEVTKQGNKNLISSTAKDWLLPTNSDLGRGPQAPYENHCHGWYLDLSLVRP